MKRMNGWSLVLAGGALACAALATAGTAAPRKGMVVDVKPARVLLMDVAKAGERLVAVGERGFVLLSDDAGQSWSAVATPGVRTLTGVDFEGAQTGVAVGHGGMIVRSEDGGASWAEVPLDAANGESLLGVVALGAGRFAAYGAFGAYFLSEDLGRTWTPHRIVAEDFEAHISQVLPVNAALWLVGESGTLARAEACCSTFTALTSPYQGSFFGMLVTRDGALVLYGMRGSIYRSADAGSSWQRVDSGTTASFNGGSVLADGRVVLVGNAGLVATSTDDARSFNLAWSPAGRDLAAVVEAAGRLVVVGDGGAGVLDASTLVSK